MKGRGSFRGQKFFANNLHKEMFLLVFFASLVPAVIATLSFYYLINAIAQQTGIPSEAAHNMLLAVRQVINILFVVIPVAIVILLTLAYQTTHKILGPFDRIVEELDKRIEGTKAERILIRKDDKFLPLVERINILLDKLRKD